MMSTEFDQLAKIMYAVVLEIMVGHWDIYEQIQALCCTCLLTDL